MNVLLFAPAIAVVVALLSLQVAFADVGDITISEVAIKNLRGNDLDSVIAASPFMLTATLTNNSTQSLSYVAVLELRDSDGITQFLEFHMSRLDPSIPSNIAGSWMPDRPGEYELRIFAISDLENPDILSTIGTATTTIS